MDVYVSNATRLSHVLGVTQTVFMLCFFATGTYMQSVADTENLCKNTVCATLN